MEDYYQTLELTPQATDEEIEVAYRSLSKEYHPDKLPPGTPEKAAKYIEEKFRYINEAYLVLSDPEKRRVYDLRDRSENKPQLGSESVSYFDPERLQAVAQRLDTLEQTIEQEYQANIGEIDRSVKSQLEILGYKEDAIQGETLLTKLWLSALFTFLAAGGWWLMTVGNSFLWWIGLVWGLTMLVMVVSTIILPTLNQASEQKLRPIREKAEADKLNATKDRDRQLATIEQHQEERIEFFRSMPSETITEQYISVLSDEDLFYLLQGIQKRTDSENLNENLANAAKIAAGVGLLAALFGLGLP
jgi:hypothetical protein